jgi:hypothetical protein
VQTLLGHDAEPRHGTTLLGACARVLGLIGLTAWNLARVALLAVLIAVEPVVATVLSAATILMLAMALFLEFGYGATPASFRFVPMLLCGLACALALLGYYALIRFLIRG